MAKYPDPVKPKKVKSAVSSAAAIRKAEAATAKAERGPVASKSRYPKMSTASGAAEAAKRGAGKARNAMGGFGKTKARPMISNEGKAANQAARRKAIEERKKATAGSRSTLSADDKLAYGRYRQGRAGGGFGKTRGYVSAPTPEDRAGSKRNVKRTAEANRASQRAAANKSAKATKKAKATGVKNKIKGMK